MVLCYVFCPLLASLLECGVVVCILPREGKTWVGRCDVSDHVAVVWCVDKGV